MIIVFASLSLRCRRRIAIAQLRRSLGERKPGRPVRFSEKNGSAPRSRCTAGAGDESFAKLESSSRPESEGTLLEHCGVQGGPAGGAQRQSSNSRSC
jgi:hypothetical protein